MYLETYSGIQIRKNKKNICHAYIRISEGLTSLM